MVANKEGSVPFYLAAASLPIIIHLVIWQVLLSYGPGHIQGWSELLSHWDSGWYNKIIAEGYADESWAFMPAYPFTVGFLAKIFNMMPVPLLGALLSAIFYLLALWTLGRNNEMQHFRSFYLVPQSGLALLFLVWTPASFVFHSHHTESLYLLLSVLALICVRGDRFWWAVVFSGCAALTRIQGYVLIAASTLLYIEVLGWQRGWRKALAFAVGAGAIASLFPLYQWYCVDDFLYFLSAQQKWTQDVGLKWQIWLKALWLGNEWQPKTVGSVIHNLYYVALVVAAIVLSRRSKAVGLYCLVCLLCMFPQGEFVDVFRYSAVLFPLHFFIGELAQKMLARPVTYCLLAGLFALNIALTYNYGIGRWAY